jgi:CheY-like chemotaxis protein
MAKKLLIVDDMESVRLLLRIYLETEGYDFVEATNGEEVLRLVEDDPPDLVIMDVFMPNMDGIECCRRIKDNPATKDIPVIIFSQTFNQKNDEAKPEEICDIYLSKGIQRDELVELVRRLLGTG